MLVIIKIEDEYLEDIINSFLENNITFKDINLLPKDVYNDYKKYKDVIYINHPVGSKNFNINGLNKYEFARMTSNSNIKYIDSLWYLVQYKLNKLEKKWSI